ncbi:MAG: AAA family ATPase [Alphaproteobacteria bacterium]|nr:AAA family ATPase [Alphaproteobacteria bacterium]
MITSVEVRNYRSFESTKIDGLQRINLIVGDNGSGKTALLEAIFLAAGPSPEIALRMRLWRGMENQQFMGTHAQIDRAVWADLFHRFNVSEPAFIGLKGSAAHTRSVTMSLRETRRQFVPRRGAKTPNLLTDYEHPVLFEWRGPGEYKKSFSPHMENGQLKFSEVQETLIRTGFYAANRTYASWESIANFSALSRAFKSEEFVATFHKHFPRIEGLSIEVAAGQTMLFATVHGFAEKIPLSLASGGMNKLAAMLLGFSAHPGGIIFFDEIENGFYYRRMPEIWASILDMARAYDVQVFVSTHSAECLKAAAGLARNNISDFSLLRTVMENDATKVRSIKAEKFVASMEEDIELR